MRATARCKAVANCGAVLNEVCLDFLHEVYEGGSVGGKGALGVAFSGKHHYSHSVSGPLGNELDGYVLSGAKAVGRKVTGKHGCGNVHCKHNVNAFRVHFFNLGGRARTGNGYHKKHHCGFHERKRDVPYPFKYAPATGRPLAQAGHPQMGIPVL